MPKIVVLDGYTVNPGDLSWEDLRSLGECEVFDRTPNDKRRKRCDGAEIILTNKVVIDRKLMESLSTLRYVGVLATGYNVVDIEAARDNEVTVCNVPAYSTSSVAQKTFALLLELTNHVALHAESVRSGEWSRCPDFAYWKEPLWELEGLTMGLVGFGNIGRAVAKLADAFGMKVIVNTAHPEKYARKHNNIDFVSLNAIFADSDIVSLHCPLTAENEELVNADRLRLMRKNAFLINTGRGQLIDENALADALNEGRISGAALDVLSTEPPSPNNPLIGAKNCIITPHIAWATKQSRERLLNTAIANVAAFLSGTPRNVLQK